MKIFEHTCAEKGLWRGWLKNGQSLEISWDRAGWEFGGGLHTRSNGCDALSRMIFVKLWLLTIVIPAGMASGSISIGDEPQWSAYVSKSYGATLCWRNRRWSRSLPWHYGWHRTSYLLGDGTWLHENRSDRPGVNKKSRFASNLDHWQSIRNAREGREHIELYPYSYTLRSGTFQTVTARVTVRETERRQHWLRWTKLGARVEREIDVKFSGEVGERAGSWKGGTIGCGYTMRDGETPLDTLRRMERERKFR